MRKRLIAEYSTSDFLALKRRIELARDILKRTGG
jgi:hypothetical protein